MALSKRIPTVNIRVSQRTKNIARSLGYVTVDVLKDLNPTLARLGSETKSMLSDVKSSLGEMNHNSISQTTKNFADPNGENIVNNLISDFKTGKWYNKEREENAIFGDMDFSFEDEDWGDMDFPDDTSDSSGSTSGGTASAMIGSMQSLGDRISVSMGKSTAYSAEYIAKSHSNDTRALYDLNKTGFNTISTILLNMNEKMDTMIQMQTPMVEAAQNSFIFQTRANEFFESTSETLNKMSTNIEKIVENTSIFAKGPGGKNTKKKYSLDQLITGEEFSFSQYFDMVGKNIKEQTSLYKSILDMGEMAYGKNGKNVSPIAAALTFGMKAMLPDVLKESFGELNKVIEGSIPTLLQKLTAKRGGPLTELLKSIFLPDTDAGRKFNTGNYNKGPVPWDGIARKSVVEVIPTYLAKIYAQLGGEEKYFDYEVGRFVTRKDIRGRLKNQRRNAAISAGGEFRTDALSQANMMFGDDAATKERVSKELELYFLKALSDSSGDYTKIKSMRGDLAQLRKLGLSRESANVLSKLIDRYEAEGKGSRLLGYNSRVIAAQGNLSRQMVEEEMRGHSNLGVLNNGFSVSTDKFNMTQSDYMRGIYQMVGNIYGLLGGSEVRGQIFDATSGNLTSNASNIFNSGSGERSNMDTRAQRRSSNNYSYTDEELKYYGMSREEIRRSKMQDKAKGVTKSFTDGIRAMIKNMHDTREFLRNPERAQQNRRREFDDAMGNIDQDDVSPFERPFLSIANAIDKLSVGITDLFWGDNGDETLGQTLKRKLSEAFTNFWENNEFVKATKEQFAAIWGGLKNFGTSFKSGFRGRRFRDAHQDRAAQAPTVTQAVLDNYARTSSINHPSLEEDDEEILARLGFNQAAKGRKITKSGMIAVSEGELIIPSEFNPFYNKKTNKSQQIRNERRILSKYYGRGYADGTTSFGEGVANVASNAGKRVGEAAYDATGAVAGAFNKFFRVIMGDMLDKDGEEKSKENIKNNIKAAMEEAGVNKGAIGAGAVIGAGASLLTGAVIGPIGAAAVGGAIGLITSSDKVQEILFGRRPNETPDEYDESFRKKVSDFINVNAPATAFGSVAGLVGGTLMGSPILGAIAGSTIGYVSTSDKAKKLLFGTPEDPKLLGKVKDELAKKLPNILGGAGVGALLGPFGIAGGAILGGITGFATTTDKFKEFMFGKTDKNGKPLDPKDDKSFTGLLRNKVFNNLDDIFHNTNNMIKGIGRRLNYRLAKFVKDLGIKAKDRILATRAGQFIAGAGQKLIKAPIQLVGGALGKVSRGLQKRNLRKGYNVWNREAGRNMTAQERLDLANYDLRGKLTGAYGYGNKSQDEGIAALDDDQLMAMQSLAKGFSRPEEGRRKLTEDRLKTLLGDFDDHANLQSKVKNKILNALRSGDVEKANKILADSGVTGAEASQLKSLISSAHSDITGFRNTENVNNELIKKIKSEYGIDLKGVKATDVNALLSDEIKGRGIDTKEKKAENRAKDADDFRVSALNLFGEMTGILASIADKVGADYDGNVRNLIKGKYATLTSMDNPLNAIKKFTSGGKKHEAVPGTNVTDVDAIASPMDTLDDETEFAESIFDFDEEEEVQSNMARGGTFGRKGSFLKNLFGALIGRRRRGNNGSPEKEVTTQIDMFGNVHQYTKNQQGELTEVTNDSETDKSRKQMDQFTESVSSIPKITGLLGGISGLFSGLKTKLFGDKDDPENSGGLFGSLLGFLSGSNGGPLTWITSFLTGQGPSFFTKGTFLGNAALAGTLALPAIFSGELNEGFNTIATKIIPGNQASNSSGNFNSGSKTATMKDGTKQQIQIDAKTGKAITDENGNYLDMQGNPVQQDDIDNVGTTESKSLSSMFKRNTVKQTLRGNLGGVAGAMIKKSKDSTLVRTASKVGKFLGKGANAIRKGGVKLLRKTTGGKNFLKKIGKTIGKSKAVAKGLNKGLGAKIAKCIGGLKTTLEKVIKKVGAKLPGGFSTSKLGTFLDDIAAKIVTKLDKLGIKAANGATDLIPVLGQVMYAVDLVVTGTNAWGDAENILGITEEANLPEKFLATVVATLNEAIPVVGGLIPHEVMIDIIISACNALGWFQKELSGLNAKRAAAKKEVEEFNSANGTNYTIEQYNLEANDKVKNGWWTSTKHGAGKMINKAGRTLVDAGKNIGSIGANAGAAIGNAISGGISNVKNFFSGGSSGLPKYSGGASGFISQYDSNIANKSFAGGTFAEKGCAPAVAAMAAGNNNLSLDNAIKASKGFQNENGVDYRYFTKVLKGAQYLTGPNSQQDALNRLANGSSVVLLGADKNNVSKDYSPFGPKNHYVLATGLDSNGNILVNDPENNQPMAYSPEILNSVKMGIGTNTKNKLNSVSAIQNDAGVKQRAKVLTPIRKMASGIASSFMNSEIGQSIMNSQIVQNASAIASRIANSRAGQAIINSRIGQGISKVGNKILNFFTGSGSGFNKTYADQIWAFLRNNVGLSEMAAAGIMGCWSCESNLRPDRVEGDYTGEFKRRGAKRVLSSRKEMDSWCEWLFAHTKGIHPEGYKHDGHYYCGVGLAQWTAGRTKNLFDYAEKNNTNVYDLDTQLNFCKKEFDGPYAGVKNSGNSKKDLRSATVAMLEGYEAGKGWAARNADGFNKRYQAAQDIYKAYTGKSIQYTGQELSTDSSSDSGSTGSTGSSTSGTTLGFLSDFANVFNSAFGIGGATSDSSSTASSESGDSSSSGATTPEGKGNVQSVLDIAKSQIGYQEKASNSKLEDFHENIGSNNWTKYGKFTGANGQPWCASFVSWVFDQAYNHDKTKRNKALRGGITAGVAQFQNQFKGHMDKIPKPGDVIIYRNGTSHTGIVESVDTKKKTFNSIEGNTSGGAQGFSRDGGNVARKTNRSWNYNAVTGFGHPDWDGASGAGSGLFNTVNYSGTGTSTGKTTTAPIKVNNVSYPTRTANNSSTVSASTVNKLLESLANLLNGIVNNTSSIDLIYQLLNQYMGNGNGNNKSTNPNAKNNGNATVIMPQKNDQEVSQSVIDLFSTLSELAKG